MRIFLPPFLMKTSQVCNLQTCATLIAFLLCSSPLLALDVLDVKPNNVFGGQTVTFRANNQGVHRGVRYYDNGHTLMKEVLEFSEGKTTITGIRTTIDEYVLNALVQKTVQYSRKDALRRRITKVIYHYEQSSELLKTKETHFLDRHKGYNIMHYNLKKKTKLEWFYPLNQVGIVKLVNLYDEFGIHIKSIEKQFAPKTQIKGGVVKTIVHFKGEKISRQEWYYTTKWAKEHLGVYKKIIAENLHPSQKMEPYVLLFDRAGKIIDPTNMSTTTFPPLD